MQGDVFTDRQTEQGSASRPYSSRESTNPEELWAQLPCQSFEAPDKRVLKLHMDTSLRGARAMLTDSVGASPHRSLRLTIKPQSTRHCGLGADTETTGPRSSPVRTQRACSPAAVRSPANLPASPQRASPLWVSVFVSARCFGC